MDSSPTIPEVIRVLLPNGSVKTLLLEDYLRGVTAAALPADAPLEALKALAVAARTFAATTHRHLEQYADVCTTRHCQAWSERANPRAARAVLETRSVVAVQNGKLIDAFYFDHCDGKTRDAAGVLVNPPSYLKSVPCPCGSVARKGHGIGMCQRGMLVMARFGENYQYILKHYYTGITLEALQLDKAPVALKEAATKRDKTDDERPLDGIAVFNSGASNENLSRTRDEQAIARDKLPTEERRPLTRHPLIRAASSAATSAGSSPATDRALSPTQEPPTQKPIPTSPKEERAESPTTQSPLAEASKPAAEPKPAKEKPTRKTTAPRRSYRKKIEQAEPETSRAPTEDKPPVESAKPLEPKATKSVETPRAPTENVLPPEPLVTSDNARAAEADDFLYYLAVEDVERRMTEKVSPTFPAPSAAPAPPLPETTPEPPSTIVHPELAPSAVEGSPPPPTMPEEMPSALDLEFIAPPNSLP